MNCPNYLQSFGRRHGRALSLNQQALLDNILPQIIIKEPNQLFETNLTDICFEIGFGNGEHLATMAKNSPNNLFVGCEPYINGVSNLVKLINQYNLTNIRIWTEDARILLEKLPENYLNKIYILFPDPWPKLKHHKRRIISNSSLNLLASKLKDGKNLIIATDHTDYALWIKEQLAANNNFKQFLDLTDEPANWIKTKYQLKAEKLGLKIYFFDYVKI